MSVSPTLPKPRSLRRDLAWGLGAGLSLLWVLAITAAGLVAREELDEVFDSALRDTAERILPLAVIELINAGPNLPAKRITRIGTQAKYLNYVVRDAEGRLLMYSHDADLAVFATPRPAGFHDTADHRIFALSAVSGAFMIEVAEPLKHRREAALETTATLFAPILLLLPFSLLGIAWFTRTSLRPVAALSAEVHDRDASDLSPLATEGLQSELLPIRDAVNRLMARLERTIEAERSFTSNAAHELRTPVAATLAQTQRLIAEAPPGPLRVRAETLEAELKRVSRLSEKLLQLSRAEGSAVLSSSQVDLVPILALVAQDFVRANGAERLDLTLPPEALSHLDPEAFAILARNLIENALIHGDPRTPVTVSLGVDGTLCVRNHGPIVPPDALARLTERFERAGSRAKGSGLGLAIVDSIANGAGARLALASPAPGSDDGFQAELRPA